MAIQYYNEENDQDLGQKCHIHIKTLGQFSVRRGNLNLSAESHKSQKMWELFKYIVANREKNILPEVIQDTIWPDQDYEYSNKALRTMIYRLRQVLKKGSTKESDDNAIIFAHGCYTWNSNIDYTLDSEEFEKLHADVRQIRKTNPTKALVYYQRMLELYKGSYLSESMYTEWTIPLRNHYLRLYLQSMSDYCNLLTEMGENNTVIEVCENVILHEPLEEDFHIRLIKALIKEGKSKDAKQMYEYITAKLYQELGVRPSSEMRNLYGQITASDKAGRSDINAVQEGFSSNPSSEGPFFCDLKTFQAIYDLERRRAERSGQSVFIVLLTLQLDDKTVVDSNFKTEALQSLKNIIDRSLRKGDIYSVWDDLQFIMILPGINMEQTKMVVGRLEKAFREKNKQEQIVLKARYQPIMANPITPSSA